MQQATDNQYCFVCGSRNPIGLKVRPEMDAERLQAKFKVTVPEEFQGWEGVVHGGIVSALLDEAAAHAAMNISMQLMTAELKVRYKKLVPVGRLLEVEGRVCTHTKRLIQVEATLKMEGQLLVTAEARMLILKAPPGEMDEQKG